MKLNNLKPAEGSTYIHAVESVVVQVLVLVVLLHVVIKVLKQDLVIRERLDSKVVRCHCSVVYRRQDSKISTIRSM
jgi:hypothetical protein